MFISKETDSMDISRVYRFPYRLVGKLIRVDLQFVESAYRREASLGICMGTYSKHGAEYFAQTHKLDEMGRQFIISKQHIGVICIREDSLELTLNGAVENERTRRQQWQRVEQIIAQTFCLTIKDIR